MECILLGLLLLMHPDLLRSGPAHSELLQVDPMDAFFSPEIPTVQMILVCVKLTKT